MSNTHTDILLAGAFAAFSVDLLIYPLDTLKTRFQSPDYNRLYVNASQQLNKGVFFRGLYQGIGSVILATIPSSGAFFTTYEATKSGLNYSNPTRNGSPLIPQPLIHAASSSTAEMVSCLILTPAEVLKQNAQMIDKKSTSSPSSPTKTATAQAFRRFRHPSQLWRGYTALVARNLPFTAMQFPLFEFLKSKVIDYRKSVGDRKDKKLSLLETGCVTAVSAGSAGAVAAIVTTPVDVVKTRIMLSAGSSPSPGSDAKESQGRGGKLHDPSSGKSITTVSNRKSSFAVASEVVKTSGWKGLMRGGAFRTVWTFFGSGLYLGVYETARVVLEDRRGDKDGRSII